MLLLILKAALAWLPMVPIAILNGIVREQGYGKQVGELAAHQISTLTGAILFGIYIWGLGRFWSLESEARALGVGLIWLVLTVAFEFGFGRLVAGKSWSRLFQDYNLLAGRVWSLLLLWIAAAPWVFHRLGW